ncbi:hypothetical protein GOP47_0021937 [Adiantum capillus-veneris]|uniref:Uncharacterized protein n=1 Tax=Adiantum capillus-veneris TaxID=13818 RepID=A0A9D4U915_ADICA|nr:hypothetical protein GOP47_0021937 [Adiantum capillus-veneris]
MSSLSKSHQEVKVLMTMKLKLHYGERSMLVADLALPQNMSFDQHVHVALSGLKAVISLEAQAVSNKNCCPSFNELDKGLKSAIRSYEEAIKRGNPFLIHSDVSYLTFEGWHKTQESHWRIAFKFLDSEGGVVLLYGDSSYLHESIAGWFTGVLVEQTALLIQAPITPLIDLIGASGIIQPSGGHKEPDFAVQPKASKWRIPPFVGEVAYGNESLSVLREELVQWTIQGGAQIAYGVKLSLEKDEASGAEKSWVRLRFLERRQGYCAFTQDLDFSPEYCTRAGDSDYLVRLPLETVLGLLQNHSVDFVWHSRQTSQNADVSPLLSKKVKDKSRGIFHRWFKK